MSRTRIVISLVIAAITLLLLKRAYPEAARSILAIPGSAAFISLFFVINAPGVGAGSYTIQKCFSIVAACALVSIAVLHMIGPATGALLEHRIATLALAAAPVFCLLAMATACWRLITFGLTGMDVRELHLPTRVMVFMLWILPWVGYSGFALAALVRTYAPSGR